MSASDNCILVKFVRRIHLKTITNKYFFQQTLEPRLCLPYTTKGVGQLPTANRHLRLRYATTKISFTDTFIFQWIAENKTCCTSEECLPVSKPPVILEWCLLRFLFFCLRSDVILLSVICENFCLSFVL